MGKYFKCDWPIQVSLKQSQSVTIRVFIAICKRGSDDHEIYSKPVLIWPHLSIHTWLQATFYCPPLSSSISKFDITNRLLCHKFLSIFPFWYTACRHWSLWTTLFYLAPWFNKYYKWENTQRAVVTPVKARYQKEILPNTHTKKSFKVSHSAESKDLLKTKKKSACQRNSWRRFQWGHQRTTWGTM